jgi:asparagine synthase (glutamine-hydrolysing)
VALMKRLVPGRIKTFSIGFTEGKYNELQHARQVSEAFNTEHHELVLEPQGLHMAEELSWYLDEPFGDSSSIPTYMVSKLARQEVKVVLTGDGGDELFAGYDKYLVEQRERSYDQWPAPLRQALGAVGRMMPEGMKGRNFLRHLALQGGRRYLDASTLFGQAEQASLFQPEVQALIGSSDPWSTALRYLATDDWLSGLQYLDFHNYLPLDILTKVDRMSMAHSIESRPALLDHRLVEFAATIPVHMRLRDRTTKYLFKRAMRGWLPDSIIDRKKQGFAVPLAHWFRGDWSGYLRDLLLSDTCRERGIFNPSYVEKLLRMHDNGRSLDHQLWTLLSFEQWCRTFLDRAPVRPHTAPSYEAVGALAPSAA